MNRTTDVAVVGGGVSGLACALRLRSLHPSLRVTIIESASELGGKVRGEIVDGCIVDGGPDLCVASALEQTAAYVLPGLASGIIPVNPDRLPTFRRHGHLLFEMPNVMTDGLITLRGGMRALIETMSNALSSVAVHTNLRARTIEREGEGYRVITSGKISFGARAVVAAIPSTSFVTSVRTLSPALVDAMSAVRYDPITTVSAAWPESDVDHALRGTGYIAKEIVPGEVSACTWTSSKIPSRSPGGVVLIRGFCRSSDPDASTKKVLGEMKRVLGITALPLFTRAFSWSEALPVYPVDHGARLAIVHRETQALGTFAVAGAAFHGVGIGDCISSGERAAESIIAAMRNPAPAMHA